MELEGALAVGGYQTSQTAALRLPLAVLSDSLRHPPAYESVQEAQALKHREPLMDVGSGSVIRNAHRGIHSWSMGLLCCSAASVTCRSGRRRVFDGSDAVAGLQTLGGRISHGDEDEDARNASLAEDRSD